jgi:hypothetical protein
MCSKNFTNDDIFNLLHIEENNSKDDLWSDDREMKLKKLSNLNVKMKMTTEEKNRKEKVVGGEIFMNGL